MAIVLRIQCFKLNAIKIKKNKNSKNLVIFFKSAGVDDIIAAFENSYSKKNIIFLPRFNFQTIQTYFLGNYNNIPDIRKNNENYKRCSKFIDSIIEKFRNLFNNEIEFLSFNLSYPEEIIIREVCFKKKIKFYVEHKESVRSPGYEKRINTKFKKKFKSFNNITKVAVYNKSLKDQLTKYNLVSKKKIEVVGFPRGIYSLRKKKKKITQIDTILYFMISPYAATLKKVSWAKISDSVEKTLFEFAKDNPKLKFIFKGKTGIHSKKIEYFKKNYNFPNVDFIDGGVGHNLITSSSIVIGFNSVSVMESIISENEVIVPFFKRFRKKPYLEFAYIYDTRLFANDEDDLKNKILKKLKTKKPEPKKYYQKIINRYFDDVQNAPRKMRNFLQ